MPLANRTQGPGPAALETAGGPAVSIGDLLGIVRRRSTLIMMVTAIATVVSGVIVFSLPDVFESHSLVYIEPARMPASYQRTGAIVPKLAQTISIMRQDVLSRDTLRDLINELDLYEVRVPGPLEEADEDRPWYSRLIQSDPILRAKKDIRIDITRRGDEEFVEITVRARTGKLAATAVTRIEELLASKSRDLRLAQEQKFKGFVESQLVGTQRKLQEAETRLSRFREANQESLPENAGQLHDRLSKLRFDRELRAERLARVGPALVDLNNRIATLRASDIAVVEGGAPSDRAALEADLKKARDELADLIQSGKGPGWPPVNRLQGTIRRLEEQLKGQVAAPQDGGPVAAPPGGSAPLVASDRLKSALTELTALTEMQTSLERDLEQNAAETARLESLKAGLVSIRTQYDRVLAEFDIASIDNKSLATDLRDIDKAIALEEAGRTDMFKRIEAAEVPLIPAAPNRLLFLGVGLVASLGIALGLAYLLEIRVQTYRRWTDVEEDLGLPVLTVLPDVGPDGPRYAVATAAAAPLASNVSSGAE